jgi:subtilase family serine protease
MLYLLRCTMALLCLTGPSLFAQTTVQSDRVAAYPEFSGSVRLAGHVPRWASAAADQGSVAGETPLNLTFVLSRTPEQQATFTQLLADQQDPASPSYHQWLTPQQVGERFGPTQHDLESLTSWLVSHGLGKPEVSPSGIFVNVRTSAASASAALSTRIHSFASTSGSHFAATQQPALPAALVPIVQSIEGLSETLEQPSVHELPPAPVNSVQPRAVSPGSANPLTVRPRYTYLSTYHYLTPDDFATIFDLKPAYAAGFLGTGQRIAVIGRSRVANTDITAFESLVGRGTNLPNVILPDIAADPGYTANGDQAEATLDVSRAVATAPLAQVDLVIVSSAGGGITTAAQYAVNSLNDPIMNISFGACEADRGFSGVTFWDTLFAQAAAQGISVFVSSGDSGVASCDDAGAAAPATQAASINYICSSSYVTCVGGTQLSDTPASTYWAAYNDSLDGSALGYIPEGAWNEPLSSSTSTPYVVLATGGGASAYIAKPAWQSGIGVPADGKRDVPDVSFPAAGRNGYYACYATDNGDCSQGHFVFFYGTSAGTPSMAAIAALLNQRTGMRLGNLNPALYRMAASANNVFHDATVATSLALDCTAASPSTCNNSTPGPASLTGGLQGYLLTPGFDLATGWGSLDVVNLLAALGSPQASTSLALSVNPSTALVGTNVVFTASIASATAGSPSGSVQFYLNGNPYGSAVAVTASTAMLTTSFASDNAGTITAYYSGDAAFAPSTSTFPAYLNVHRLYPTIAVSPAKATISVTAPQGFTISVSASGPVPTGTVQLQQISPSQANLGTFAMTNGNAVVPPITFSPGSFTIQVTYSGDPNYETTFIYANLTVNGLAASLTLTPGLTSISPPQNASFVANLTASSGTPTGTMQLFIDSLSATPALPINGAAPIQFSAPKVSLGTHTVYASYSGDTLFGAQRSNVVTLTNSGFVINPAGYGYNFTAGATNTVVVTYQSVAGFTGTIDQNCAVTAPTNSIQPNYAPQCSFSPATVTLGPDATATSTLTITSVVPHAVTDHQLTRNTPSLPGRMPTAPTAAAAAGAALCCSRRSRRRIHRLRSFALWATALLALSGLVACGSGTSASGSSVTTNPSTATTGPGFYAVVITGTSGSVVETSSAINTLIQ